MSIIKMILLIGLLIFVHELGHFLVARMFKIKVERFCFGLPFGPILFEKKIGEVTYGIHWLFFLGGYVSFPDDNKDNGLPPDSPELFKNKPIYQRACVLLAGVTANFITAYLLVLLCCLHWHYLPSGTYDVYFDKFGENVKTETLNSGFKEGDKIVSINGRKVIYPPQPATWYHDMCERYSVVWVCKPDIDKAAPNQIPNVALYRCYLDGFLPYFRYAQSLLGRCLSHLCL